MKMSWIQQLQYKIRKDKQTAIFIVDISVNFLGIFLFSEFFYSDFLLLYSCSVMTVAAPLFSYSLKRYSWQFNMLNDDAMITCFKLY